MKTLRTILGHLRLLARLAALRLKRERIGPEVEKKRPRSVA
jgi:hypothetical protein